MGSTQSTWGFQLGINSIRRRGPKIALAIYSYSPV